MISMSDDFEPLSALRDVSSCTFTELAKSRTFACHLVTRLEALRGKRKGQYSIRINDQWRICFRFRNGNAYDVEIVDYH